MGDGTESHQKKKGLQDCLLGSLPRRCGIPVASELRCRGVPGWEVSGLIGHKRGRRQPRRAAMPSTTRSTSERPARRSMR